MAHQPARQALVFSVEVVRDGDEARVRPLDIAAGPELAGISFALELATIVPGGGPVQRPLDSSGIERAATTIARSTPDDDPKTVARRKTLVRHHADSYVRRGCP